MPELGDIIKVYVKPSLDGALVIRKKKTVQTSARLAARKKKIAEAKPASAAHSKCVAAGKSVKKRIYKAGVGYEEKDVCPIKQMKTFLRESMPA